MSDIVDELRFVHCRVDTSGRWLDADVIRPIMNKAADEIERLRDEVDRLRSNLKRMHVRGGSHDIDALKEQP